MKHFILFAYICSNRKKSSNMASNAELLQNFVFALIDKSIELTKNDSADVWGRERGYLPCGHC